MAIRQQREWNPYASRTNTILGIRLSADRGPVTDVGGSPNGAEQLRQRQQLFCKVHAAPVDRSDLDRRRRGYRMGRECLSKI